MITTEPTTIAEAEPILELPGIVATKTSLTVFDSATNTQLIQAFAQIAKMEKSVAWWLGDLGIALQERKRQALAVEVDELRSRAGDCSDDAEGIKAARDLRARADKLEATELIRYTAEICDLFGIDQGFLKNCVSLCTVFEPSLRGDGLRVNHFRVVLNGMGGVEALKKKKTMTEALAWLDRAKENNWPAPELRKNICLSHATFHAPTEAAEVNQFAELDAADAWAIQHANDVIDPRAAVPMVTRWQALIAFLNKVQSLANVR